MGRKGVNKRPERKRSIFPRIFEPRPTKAVWHLNVISPPKINASVFRGELFISYVDFASCILLVFIDVGYTVHYNYLRLIYQIILMFNLLLYFFTKKSLSVNRKINLRKFNIQSFFQVCVQKNEAWLLINRTIYFLIYYIN